MNIAKKNQELDTWNLLHFKHMKQGPVKVYFYEVEGACIA